MYRSLSRIVLLALLSWVGICHGQSPPQGGPSWFFQQISEDTSGKPSGLFLMSVAPDAISIPVKHAFMKPEPKTYSIFPKPKVTFSDMRLARAGGLFQPGGHTGLSRNKYEKDNKGYRTHIYLKPEASQSLAQTMAQKKTDVVLVINGIGKGRVEPVDLRKGHWAVANIRIGGPGGYLTVTINTHIIIAWNESGQAPNPTDRDRQEVEYSLREYIYQHFWQSGGSGIGGPISSGDFARTGDIGAVIYAEFIDSDDAKRALQHQGPRQGFNTMARSFSSNHAPAMQASVFQHVKNKEFRRALACGIPPFVSWALNNNPKGAEYQKMVFTDDDPLIVANSFIFAPSDAIQAYRAEITKSLNTCLTTKIIPSNSRLYDQIVTANLTECAPALAQYLKQSDNARTVEQGVKTLGQMGAHELLGDLVISLPIIDKRQLRRTFQFFRWEGDDDKDANQKSAVLVRLSDAGLKGQWTSDVDAHKILVSAMFSFLGANSRSGPLPERTKQDAYQRVRRALYAWIPKSGGFDVLVRLASDAPMASEVPFFIKGLKHSDAQTVMKCITALSRLEVRGAMPAIIAVFDREDALDDLHAQRRSRTREKQIYSNMVLPPRERDNIAYGADKTLFHLAGGKEENLESTPPFKDKTVLEQRRAYWKRWLQVNWSKVDTNMKPKDGAVTSTAN